MFVIAMQEVRFDTSFAIKIGNSSPRVGNAPRPKDIGSQAEHLLHFISEACEYLLQRYKDERADADGANTNLVEAVRSCSEGRQPYQIIYTPAMLLLEV